jgi:two-component system response regulator (stage 0 sporulation protein F)
MGRRLTRSCFLEPSLPSNRSGGLFLFAVDAELALGFSTHVVEVFNMTIRILSVDDSRLGRRIVAHQLEQDDYEVREAESGEQAVQMVADERPSCMLLDLQMPGMDGKEVLRTLKEKDLLGFPVVILTAEGGDDIRKDCLALGAFKVLAKGGSPDALREAVREALAATV